MQREDGPALLSLRVRQHAPIERRLLSRVEEGSLRVARGETGKLAHEQSAALPDSPFEIAVVIRKVQERRRRGELLALKQHRRAGREEPECRDRAIDARIADLMQPLA